MVVVTFGLIALSSLPLVVSIYLFVLIWSYASAHQILLPNVVGRCELTSTARIKHQGEEIQLTRIDSHFLFLGLILHGEKHQRFIVWRDSCDERDYRQLLVLIKRRLSLRE
jgi:hypothetical protein